MATLSENPVKFLNDAQPSYIDGHLVLCSEIPVLPAEEEEKAVAVVPTPTPAPSKPRPGKTMFWGCSILGAVLVFLAIGALIRYKESR